MKKSNIIALASTLFNRAKLAAQVGKTFNGARDLYEKLGYDRNINFDQYLERYHRGGVAGTVVDAFPKATWRNAPKIKEKGKKTGESKFVKEFEKLAERLRLYHYLERVDRMSGIGSYGTLLIGTKTASSLTNPIRHVKGPEDVIYLSVFTEKNACIKSLDDSLTSPRYGMPDLYALTLSKELATVNLGAQARDVHHSHLLHVAENLQEDEIFGQPRMRRVWNYLDDLDKVVGGSSEAIWLTVDRGIQWDIDKDAQLDENDKEAFADEIDEYQHGLRRHVRTQGITANVLGNEVPDPKGGFSAVISVISGTSGIPQRILLGSEAGQLASSQDERNFNGKVLGRQEQYVEPTILRPFIDRMIMIGALPEAEYEIAWPDPSTLTRKEGADVAARVAQAVRNVASQRKQGEVIITSGEFREEYLGLPHEKPEGEEVIPEPEPAPAPEPTPEPEVRAAEKKVEAQPINVTVNNTTPPVQANIENHLPPVTVMNEIDVPVPSVLVEGAEVSPTTVVVNVPEQEAPNVIVENNVEVPSVHIENKVETPEVNVSNEVNLPETNVKVENKIETPEPVVNVNIEQPCPDQEVDFERDPITGNITGAKIKKDDA